MVNINEIRRSGLGGTDIAAIMGLNPYKTAYQVYLEKVHGQFKDLSNNEAVKRGTIFEAPAAELYELQTGKKTYCTGTVIHKDYPFLIAHPDRIIPEESRGVEIKTVGQFSQKEWGESGSQTIPEHYYMQIAHYMFVMDYQYWDLAALFHDYEIRIYSFERNPEIDKIILECAESFWKNNVETKTPPDIAFSSPFTKDLIKGLYRDVIQETIQLDNCLILTANSLNEVKKEILRLKRLSDAYESEILSEMGNAEIGEFSNGSKFFRKVIKRKEYTVKESEYIRLDYRQAKSEVSL